MTSYLEERANLKGKVAAVLGGGGGIGAAASLALAKAGVDLAVSDIDEKALGDTAKEISTLGRKVITQVFDVTDTPALDKFYRHVGDEFDRLDVVVNLAGGTHRGPTVEATPEAVQRDIERNYGYVIRSVQRAVPLIRKGGRGGSIINFTTIEAHRGAAGFSVYAGAKAATTNFTRAMAVELGAEGIRLNCIAPDTTPSQGNANALEPEIQERFEGLPEEALMKGMAMYVPAGISPPVEALGDAVLFLASDLSAFVSGMSLHVDGGTMAASGFLRWPFGDGFVPTGLAGTIKKLFVD